MAKEKNTAKNTEAETPAKERKERAPLPKGFHRSVPIVLAAMAVFSAVCFIADGVGSLGGFLADFLLGMFSYGAYAVPVLLALHAVFYPSDIKSKRLLTRVIFSFLALTAISSAIYTFQYYGTEAEFLGLGYYAMGILGEGGGLVGSSLSYALTQLFGYIGVAIIAVAFIAVYAVYFFSGSGKTMKRVGIAIIKPIVFFLGYTERGIKKFFAFIFGKSARDKRSRKKTEELFDDDFFAVDNGIESLVISDLGIAEKRSREAIEANPTLHEKVRKSPEREERTFDFEIDNNEGAGGKVYASFEDLGSGEGRADEPTAKAASADDIFTKEFDPYNLALAEELANRPSTKAKVRTEATVTEAVPDSAPAAKEASLRNEEHGVSGGTRPSEATSSDAGADYRKKSFEFTETSSESFKKEEESESFSVTFEKNEESNRERYTSEYVKNSYGDNPYYSESENSTSFERHAEKAEDENTEADGKGADIPDFRGFEPAAMGDYGVTEKKAEDEPPTLNIERSFVGAGEDAEPEDEEEEEELSFPDGAEDELDPDTESEEIPEEEQNPAISGYRDMFTMFSKDKDAQIKTEEDTADESSDEDFDEPPFDEPPFDEPLPFERDLSVGKKEVKKSAEIPEKKADALKSYTVPPIDLMEPGEEMDDSAINAEIEQNANTLLETLADFGVTATLVGVDRGPRITRYEIVQARGVQLRAVTSKFNDIVQNLGTDGVRMEAPIPGKITIGFEIPNKHPSTVRLRELLECEEFVNAKSKTFVCIGKDVAGKPIFGDIAKFPHALVAGATGMGKSVCINSIMISMLYKARPDEVKFIMIDPKKVEFRMYSGIPHLLIPVITEAKQAAGALMWAVEEMERRYGVIEQHNLRNIEGYNEKRERDKSLEALPKIVIVIDELNDLMMQVRDPVEGLIMRLVQKARAAGIHLIIGTQRPDVKVVTGTIKANINTRIACKVTSNTDSRTILDMAGAEKLLDRGDMLFKPVDKTTPIRVQGCFVADSEVEDIMNFLKNNSDGDSYNEEVFAEVNRAAAKCGNKKNQDDGDDGDDAGCYSDQQFLDAVHVAISSGKISTSLLQRKLSIGYGKAAKYIDTMEAIGVVSSQNGMKPRDVLMTMDEWHEKLSRVDLG